MRICGCGKRFEQKYYNQSYCTTASRLAYNETEHGRWYLWARGREKEGKQSLSFKKWQLLHQLPCYVCEYNGQSRPYSMKNNEWKPICYDCFSLLMRASSSQAWLAALQTKINTIRHRIDRGEL
jgi:hypothetical protein